MSSKAIINMGWSGSLQMQTLEGDSHNEISSHRSFFKNVF